MRESGVHINQASLLLVAGLALITTVQLILYIRVSQRHQQQQVAEYISLGCTKKIDISLPIYWINLDASLERRRYMKEQFSRLSEFATFQHVAVRVPAITVSQVQSSLATTQFIPNGVQIVMEQQQQQQQNKSLWDFHRQGQYKVGEVACTMSHLDAIRRAYAAGHEFVMIVEDDVKLPLELLTNWKEYANLAPSDWNILQWTCSNSQLKQHFQNLHHHHDPWVSWTPDHYGTIAYVVRREGMRRILRQTMTNFDNSNYNNKTNWRIAEPGVLTADELVFYLGKQSYTSTFPWVGHAGLTSTLGKAKRQIAAHDELSSTLPARNISSRPERVLVLTTLFVSTEVDISIELEQLQVDVAALAVFHPAPRAARWSVTVIVQDMNLRDQVMHSASELPDSVVLLFRNCTKEDASSLTHLKYLVENDTALKEFKMFDYVLVKNIHVRLAGFAWNTFMERKGEALISAPLQENVEESLIRHIDEEKQQWYQFFEAAIWRKKEITEFAKVSSIPAMYLDHSFVLLKAEFAEWFLEQELLTPLLASQFVDLLLDKLWCGAAKTFSQAVPSCVLVPVIAKRELITTTQQVLSKDEEEYYQDIAERLFKENTLFRSWINSTEQWDLLIGDGSDAFVVQNYCETDLGIENSNLTECATQVASGSVLILEENSS